MPLSSVSVSSTKPTLTSRNRKRSSVSSGGSPPRRARPAPRCSRRSKPISTSACSAATMNSAYATSATAMCKRRPRFVGEREPVRIGEQQRQQHRDRRDRQHDQPRRRAARPRREPSQANSAISPATADSALARLKSSAAGGEHDARYEHRVSGERAARAASRAIAVRGRCVLPALARAAAIRARRRRGRRRRPRR